MPNDLMMMFGYFVVYFDFLLVLFFIERVRVSSRRLVELLVRVQYSYSGSFSFLSFWSGFSTVQYGTVDNSIIHNS